MPKVYIETLNQDYLQLIQKGFEWIDFGSKVKRGDCIFIKPNLTFPTFRKGVMTNPEALEALIV